MRQSHCSRHEQLVRLSLLVALATYAALTLPAAAQTQTLVPPLITADATDYSAGDDVFIAGDHWNPGEFVMLQIREDGNPGHVDTLHVTADAAGGVTAEYVVPGHGTTQTFTLTATGASTGAQASAVFSNAFYPASVSWDTADWATAAPTSTPWIRTNRDDYQPGDFALFAGGGWFPGDLVTINLAKTGSDHVHPSVQLHAVADETGSISAAYVLQPHDLGESYELIAASAADPTMLARTTFSDSGFNFHTCALTTNGGARCWGANGSGQLGDGTTLQRLSQVGVSGLSSGVVLISTGAEHTCSLTTGGGVKCSGRNSDGELGDGTTTQQNTPVAVSGLTSGVIHIGAGMHHTCAVTSGGGVKCWGWNGFGQLGDGTSSSSSTPVNVFGLASGIAQVRAGGFHSCALTTDGGVKCWGWNFAGQLGNGTTSTSLVPVDVSGLAIGVVQISTGGDHTCAVTTGGGVKCWGQNTNGQLGDGTTTNQTTPVDVSGLTSGVVQVATGSFHTCALTTAGGVKCWGFNGANRLGDGTNVAQRLLPANVVGLLSGGAQIYAGSEHTCALTTTGGMKCWGYNGFGNVGDGTNVNRPTQVNVSGLTTGVIAVPEVTATTYTVSYLAGAHGTINGAAAQIVYAGQSGTAVTAVPDAGYHFVAWSDGLLSATRTDSSVVASLTRTASFAPDSHALTYAAEAHGAISGTSPQTVNDGADGTPVTAQPDTGYHFVTWSDGVLTATRTDMHVTADITVTASFAINTYVLTYTAGAHGTVSGTSPQAVDHFADGSPVTAVADTGYHFVEWSDGSTANPRSELGVTGPITVVAGFAVNQYTVTYTAGAHGSISGAASQTIDHGTNATSVTALPDKGYHFVQWSDGSNANPRTDTNVVANIAVSASFAEVPYVVTGFFSPVDMPHVNVLVWNSAQAGQTVPVKWRLTKNGVPVSDPESFRNDPGGLFSYPVNCSSGDGSVDLAIEEYAPGNSSLVYKGDGHWQFNWQTLTAYKGSCRVMFVRFRDGTVSATANFKFK
jgi:alpha-tubulin suppressor-like RCC1 family protein